MRLRAVEQVTTQIDHFHGFPFAAPGGAYAEIVRTAFANWKRFLSFHFCGRDRRTKSSTGPHNIPICQSYKAREEAGRPWTSRRR